MTDEIFLTGYCRSIDQSRMVTVETGTEECVEVDCSFYSCPYAKECMIGKEIRKLLK